MKELADAVRITGLAVNPLLAPFAILCGLVLAAVALSFVTLSRARMLVRAAGERIQMEQQHCEALVESMRKELTGLAAQFHEIRQQPPVTMVPGPAKPGLNLTKRSQVLRMHRRGDDPVQIASALEIPLQEVDLLLKVHRIVISSI